MMSFLVVIYSESVKIFSKEYFSASSCADIRDARLSENDSVFGLLRTWEQNVKKDINIKKYYDFSPNKSRCLLIINWF